MRWYESALSARRKVTVRSAYDAAANTCTGSTLRKRLRADSRQTVKLPMTMPLAFGLVGP